jgi:uncharacterized protein YcbX
MSWTLSQIWVYPIKSLPGVAIDASEILPAGNLRHDREFALFDTAGRFVNAKLTAEIHAIQAEWDLDSWSVTLFSPDVADRVRFHLDRDRERLAGWLSQVLNRPIRLEQREVGGFPDDLEASGPTIVTKASLKSVADWFPGLSLDEVRLRFRANLELEGGLPFSEDRLFGIAGETVEFQIGEAILSGTNPCQRCVVPTRSPHTGEIWPLFQKTFAENREATLPDWAELSRFNHFYRLAVNTRTASVQTQSIRIGDPVRVM